jgi:alpha-L-fucosidase 2
MHHNTDLWRITGPVDGGFYGMWPMGGAWLSQHLWQHFLFTGDDAFLKDVYPVLKGAALYYVDALQEEPTHKWLVVAPSMSPENSYKSGVGLSAGTTMDNQLVFDVFSNIISASDFLHTDQAFADTIKAMIQRLPPMQIGQYSQLQEWLHDWDLPKSTHRHVSHLYGLYPSNQISPYHTPELFEAARIALINRGDKSTGWSMGWKVNWWARLHDGNHAYKLITDQLAPAPVEQKGQAGGTYPNLFDAHPPFQIDGNFGCTSGIAEMLLQSQDGAIEILPALPDAWKKGHVNGLIARGGFKIAIDWDNNIISKITVKSSIGGNCRLRVGKEIQMANGGVLVKANGVNHNFFYQEPSVKAPIISSKAALKGIALPVKYEYDFTTQPGKTYVLTVK